MAGLTQDQHIFLQALMARSVMREGDARKLHGEIVGRDPASDPRAFDRFWGQIASGIGYLDLDIRRVKYQEVGEVGGVVIEVEGGVERERRTHETRRETPGDTREQHREKTNTPRVVFNPRHSL